jgi:hypothetical protein
MAKVNQFQFFFFFLLAFLFTIKANAQYADEDDRLFFGGLIFGANYSQVDGDNFAGYHRVGLNAGAVLYVNIGKPLALSFELLYAQKGARAGLSQLPKLMNDQSGVITDYKIRLNYAEIPLLINYFDTKKNNFGLGFSGAYLGSSKETYRDGNGAIFEQEAKLFPFKKFDLNLVLNGGAHIWKGLIINLRMQYSLASIRNASNSLTGRQQQFNNVVATRLMYIF